MKFKLLTKTVLLIVIVFLSSCNDDDNPVSPERITKTVNSLTGKVFNYREEANIAFAGLYGDSSTYTIMGLDTISSDAVINLPLRTPSDDQLISAADLFKILGNGLYISDTSARGTNFLDIRMYGTGFITGTLSRRNAPFYTDDFVGLSDVYYYYADRQVFIVGTLTNIYSIGGVADTTVYDIELNMAKGWNVVSFELRAFRNNYRLFSVHTGEPSGTEWYFVQQ